MLIKLKKNTYRKNSKKTIVLTIRINIYLLLTKNVYTKISSIYLLLINEYWFFFQLMTFLFKNNQFLNYKNKPLEYTNTTYQKLYYSFF